MPAGYDTPLRATPLSGGESQRLGLARALTRTPRLLILDDATSSLDTVTETQVSAALAEAMPGRTRLIVAHRATTAARSDLVAWLQHGRLRSLAPHHLLWPRVLIPQQAYVFTGTLRDNLTYLRPDATTVDLEQSVDLLGIGPLRDQLGGYDTTLDPTALSAGERQLIALARAHLAPAPLAILDEATCHLDPHTEARVEHAFLQRHGTLVVIAHRISSARRAEKILVMDGATPPLGTHRELLGRSTLYADLAGHWTHHRPPEHPTAHTADATRSARPPESHAAETPAR